MKNLFIITGSSRGIGRAIVFALNNHFSKDNNTFVLIARDVEKLSQLKEKLKGEVIVVGMDLADIDNVSYSFEEELSKLSKDFDRCVLINNAGIIKPIGFLG